jgi:hypothetical protein
MNMLHSRVLFFLLIAMLFSFPVAAQKYWISLDDGDWSDAGNWSTSATGPGGVAAPGSGERAIFQGTGGANGKCTLNMAPSVASISISGYSGTIDLNGNTLTIGNTAASAFATGVIVNSGVLASVTLNSSSQTLTFSGTSFGEKINLTTNSRQLQLNGSTFGLNGSLSNGQCIFQCIDGNSSTSTGNNTFNMPVSFSLTSTTTNFRWDLTSTNPDIFNNTLSVSLTGNASRAPVIRFATGGNCTFNGDVTLGCNYTFSSSVGGIHFGNGDNVTGAISTGGTSTLGSSAQMSITSPYNGRLRMERFVQVGTSTTTFGLSNSNNTELTMGACTFNGSVAATAGRMSITSTAFNGTANQFTVSNLSIWNSMIGGGNSFGPADASLSTTIFETTVGFNSRNLHVGAATLTSPDSKILGSGADTYYSSVTFRHSGGGIYCGVKPAYSSSSTYHGNITWDNNSSEIMRFGDGGGASIVFSGSNDQTLNRTAGVVTLEPLSIKMNKTGSGKVILNTPVTFSNIDFTSGIIQSTATKFISISGTVSNASSASHVDGPIERFGTTAFVFPTGDGGHYRPIRMSAPSAYDSYTAEYFYASARTLTANVTPPLVKVSGCEYWTMTRLGTTTTNIGLDWNSADCPNQYVLDLSDLRMAQLNGGTWMEVSSSASGSNAFGIISSTAALSTFTAFTLASITEDNPLPVELLNFTANQHDNFVAVSWQTATEVNSDLFEVERSDENLVFHPLGIVPASGISHTVTDYSFLDVTPSSGNIYYRLRRVDRDESVTFSELVHVHFTPLSFSVYPNPVKRGELLFFNGDIENSAILFDHLGRHESLPLHSGTLDTSLLLPGVYTLMTNRGDRLRVLVK